MAPSNDHLPPPIKLTLQHHIKAKLIFFWTRYPSMSTIQKYFPDVHHPSDIEQIAKFFEASRTFFYNKIEQEARRLFALHPRMRHTAITVPTDSNLYKTLHYYFDPLRSTKPPKEFHHMTICAAREYFYALQRGDHEEPAYRRRVTRIVQLMEEDAPEWLQSSDFMEFVHPEGEPPSR